MSDHKSDDMIIQEYNDTEPGRDYRLFVLGGEVVASMSRQAVDGVVTANISMGGKAEVFTPSEEASEMAIRATKAFGALYAGVDILNNNGHYVVLEVNISPGLKVGTINGIDLAELLIKEISNSHE